MVLVSGWVDSGVTLSLATHWLTVEKSRRPHDLLESEIKLFSSENNGGNVCKSARYGLPKSKGLKFVWSVWY